MHLASIRHGVFPTGCLEKLNQQGWEIAVPVVEAGTPSHRVHTRYSKRLIAGRLPGRLQRCRKTATPGKAGAEVRLGCRRPGRSPTGHGATVDVARAVLPVAAATPQFFGLRLPTPWTALYDPTLPGSVRFGPQGPYFPTSCPFAKQP